MRKIRDLIPIKVIDGKLIAYKGNTLYSLDRSFKKTKIGYLPYDGFFKWILNYSSLTRRIFRLGIHDLVFIKDEIIFSFNNKIYKTPKNKFGIKSNILPCVFKGSRPLNISTNGEEVLFGEYFSNSKRNFPVKIFKYKNGKIIDFITFKKGFIRHIHNCIYDKFNNRWFALTGDDDNESKIIDITSSTFKVICGGKQSYRSVEAVITDNNRIIIPSDTPLEINYIREFNFETKELRDVKKIAGPVFHCKKIDDLYLITTIIEKSYYNDQKYVYLYASLDGKNWRKILRLKKSFFPVRLGTIFRYPEIKPLSSIVFDNYLIFEVRSINSIGHGMFILDKKFVYNKLKS